MKSLVPEASSAPPKARRRYAIRTIPLSLIFVFSFLATSLSKVFEMGGPFQPWLLIASTLSFLVIVFEFVVLMRSLDELQQRIHVTSLAIGFGAVGVLNFLIGGFQLIYTPSDPDELLELVGVMSLPAAILIYYTFLHIISGRYR